MIIIWKDYLIQQNEIHELLEKGKYYFFKKNVTCVIKNLQKNNSLLACLKLIMSKLAL